MIEILGKFVRHFHSKNESKRMLHRVFYLPFVPSLLCATVLFGQRMKAHFADRRILGLRLGYFASEIAGDFELECHSSLRINVSLNDDWCAGLRTQVIWARNFETPMDTFFSAGPWLRYYCWKYSNYHRP